MGSMIIILIIIIIATTLTIMLRCCNDGNLLVLKGLEVHGVQLSAIDVGAAEATVELLLTRHVPDGGLLLLLHQLLLLLLSHTGHKVLTVAGVLVQTFLLHLVFPAAQVAGEGLWWSHGDGGGVVVTMMMAILR